GTATFDGLSIAWAVSEFLATDLKSRTVFATHYHELNALTDSLTNVANFQALVEETGKDLVFLHRIAPGGANRSYGIEAARLAGVPTAVVQRARKLLGQLEQDNPQVQVIPRRNTSERGP
ncbi:MAG: DNA mismatch repair protein MutS, partial [Prochlorococcaceae cyanobacterium ETNP18_MAG_14]|nr:DNA mismatch repair protein MutS [Prochlorococcaceae cyanobacterium ETNP18_MAG_14]